jgi:SAM-dependent methyltransferase
MNTNQHNGTVLCPVCTVACSKAPLYTYSSAAAASHFCPVSRGKDRHDELRRCISRLWHGDSCRILRCDHCGFAFGYPFVGGDEEFYRLLHASGGYPRWKWDFDVGMAELAAFPRGGQVLDVGAGSGQFLRRLPDVWRGFATEGSDVMRELLRSRRIEVFETLTEAARSQAGRFQIVTLFQVLEHLSDFRDVLATCRELLQANGRIVVVVPDGNAMIRQERVTGSADMPPNHICKWTPDSLCHALNEAGFRIRRTQSEPRSLKSIRGLLHLRLIADAYNPRSLAAKAYGIQRRQLRIAMLGALSLGGFARLLPHIREWPLSGSFATVGEAA